MYANKQCMVRTNKVAPVIIKDCREEFQQFLEFNEPIVKGSLADGMPEHPLIKVSHSYFLLDMWLSSHKGELLVFLAWYVAGVF